MRTEFPIPNLPPPPAPSTTSEARVSPLQSPLDPSSQDTNKENAPEGPQPSAQAADAGELPKQIADMLAVIVERLETFTTYPPHTIQRLSELVLEPRAHYRALASYLHAVDRVVQVTSGTNTYPLPPAIPDMSSMHINGEDPGNPAASIAWSNPTTAALGTDEALGGALLTPIPWLTKRNPESGQDAPGAQIHSESNETIDGPNGMGTIETVSVSVNGVPSTGHARGITQGELLRQEQKAGVVPVSQLSRAQDALVDDGDVKAMKEDEEPHEDEEETPHARGPEEIGVNDTGPQAVTTSRFSSEGGLEMQDIDVEAAVGRKHEEDDGQAAATGDGKTETNDRSPTPEGDARRAPFNGRNSTLERSLTPDSVGSKREADQELEGEPLKKVKEQSDREKDEDKAKVKEVEEQAAEKKATPPSEGSKSGDGNDKMDTE